MKLGGDKEAREACAQPAGVHQLEMNRTLCVQSKPEATSKWNVLHFFNGFLPPLTATRRIATQETSAATTATPQTTHKRCGCVRAWGADPDDRRLRTSHAYFTVSNRSHYKRKIGRNWKIRGTAEVGSLAMELNRYVNASLNESYVYYFYNT